MDFLKIVKMELSVLLFIMLSIPIPFCSFVYEKLTLIMFE